MHNDNERSRSSGIRWLALLVLLAEGCRAASAQPVPHRARHRDAGVVVDASRDASTAATDAQRGPHACVSNCDAGVVLLAIRETTADAGGVLPPLNLGPMTPSRPIGGEPDRAPERTIPLDDGGAVPLN